MNVSEHSSDRRLWAKVGSTGSAYQMTSVPATKLCDKGEDVTVLEPVELREMVVKTARGALANYCQIAGNGLIVDCICCLRSFHRWLVHTTGFF
jgi:hypothetical protein